jgi:hypothetical protein
VFKGEFLGIFLFLKNILSMNLMENSLDVTKRHKGIYIGNLNEVLRFDYYAQDGPLRWYCAGWWTSAFTSAHHTSRVARRAHAK